MRVAFIAAFLVGGCVGHVEPIETTIGGSGLGSATDTDAWGSSSTGSSESGGTSGESSDSSSGGSSSSTGPCPIGAAGCPCTEGDGCDAGLMCSEDVCVPADPCTKAMTGSEGCQCTPGGGCDPGLECISDVCVDPP